MHWPVIPGGIDECALPGKPATLIFCLAREIDIKSINLYNVYVCLSGEGGIKIVTKDRSVKKETNQTLTFLRLVTLSRFKA